MSRPRRPFKIGVGDLQTTKADRDAVARVLVANRLSYGNATRSFEKRFASIHGAKFGIFTNSGTSSLEITLAALKELRNWEDGDEVLVPAVTFVATSNVVLMQGLRPVFVDVDPRTYDIDASQIETHITDRTKAIIPVHLLGLPAEMGPITDIARSHELAIIEDSAETMFASYRGRPVGSLGDIGCFSTYIAHYIVTGVGGINTTSDPQLAITMRSLMNHGRDSIYLNIDDSNASTRGALHEVIARRFRFVRLGYSYRATEMEAALGLSQLKRYKNILRRRVWVANQYLKKLSDLKEYLQLPFTPPDRTHSFMLFGLVEKTGSKVDLVNYLEDSGIETRDLLPLINQPFYVARYGDLAKNYPVASYLNQNGFYIGCHQYLGRREVDLVSKAFHKFYAR